MLAMLACGIAAAAALASVETGGARHARAGATRAAHLVAGNSIPPVFSALRHESAGNALND